MRSESVLSVMLGATLLACSPVGSDYVQPEIALASSFVGGAGAPIAGLNDAPWWREFNDPLLNDLVGRGLSQNLDVAAAVARISAAEANLRGTGLASQITGSLDGQTRRSGADGIAESTSDSATLTANYTIDLFGGIHRGQQEAQANLAAAKADVGTVRLAFLSAIVGAYLQARYNQEALALTRQNVATLRETLSLVTTQRKLGDASELDLARAQSDLDSALANLPDLEAAFEAEVFRIATLLAEPAAPLLRRMQPGAAQPYPGKSGSIGIPADLLRNRPDIRAAESRLAADVAAVGVSEADLYPSVKLSGTLTESESDSWSFGPTLSLPIFNRAVLTARRDVALAEARQSEIDWRTAILDAVEDVQIAQSAYSASRRKVAALRAVVASNDRVLDLTRRTYEAGASNLLELLDAQQSNTTVRQTLAAAVLEQASTWAQVQIATGRGWEMDRT